MSGAHCASMSQVRREPGKLCLSEATAGSAWITSPMAPKRTIRIRGPALLLLTVLDMFAQTAGAKKIGRFFPYNFIWMEMAQQRHGCWSRSRHHVVYHA